MADGLAIVLDQINDEDLSGEADAIVASVDDATSAECSEDALANLRCAMDAALRFARLAGAILRRHGQ